MKADKYHITVMLSGDVPAHLGFVPAAQSSLPVGTALDMGHGRATGNTGLVTIIGLQGGKSAGVTCQLCVGPLASCTYLFFGTVATDHSIGSLHWMVLTRVMADITGVRLATARKPVCTLCKKDVTTELQINLSSSSLSPHLSHLWLFL